MSKTCIIIGAGIAGLTAALTLLSTSPNIKCTIYELRKSPSTIGGSINLTPNALRLLSSLGVFPKGCPVDAIELFSIHTGSTIGKLPFQKSGGALRVLREELQRALLDVVKEKGVKIVFGCGFQSAAHESEGVTVRFTNGLEAKGDFVLGCDGMHSSVRTLFVDPDRLPIYTGVAVAYSVFSAEGLSTHFQSTALNSGRYGSLMTTYVDPERKMMSAGAVMEIPPQENKEGWKQRGQDHDATMKEITRRFEDSRLPCLIEIVQRMEEPIFYPVYKLGPVGIWCKGKVLLLGDAAHGMPPQGESTGLAIEDVVLFGRVLASYPNENTERVFQIYENTRRPRINAAYEETLARWENVRDKSWLEQKLVEFFTSVWLWWKRDVLEANFAYDVRDIELVL